MSFFQLTYIFCIVLFPPGFLILITSSQICSFINFRVKFSQMRKLFSYLLVVEAVNKDFFFKKKKNLRRYVLAVSLFYKKATSTRPKNHIFMLFAMT